MPTNQLPISKLSNLLRTLFTSRRLTTSWHAKFTISRAHCLFFSMRFFWKVSLGLLPKFLAEFTSRHIFGFLQKKFFPGFHPTVPHGLTLTDFLTPGIFLTIRGFPGISPEAPSETPAVIFSWDFSCYIFRGFVLTLLLQGFPWKGFNGCPWASLEWIFHRYSMSFLKHYWDFNRISKISSIVHLEFRLRFLPEIFTAFQLELPPKHFP